METETETPPPHSLLVRGMGVLVEVCAADEESHHRLARQWSRALVPEGEGSPADAFRRLYAWEGTADNQDARDYSLTTQVTIAALQATTGKRLNFHAGGLSDEQGRVLVVVGPSGSGKTTATRVLAKRLGYVSDETVSLDAAGGILPHAKPLSVLVDPEQPTLKTQVSPDDLGLGPTPEAATIGRFVVLHRGVPEPQGLIRLDAAEGLLELIQQSSSVAAVTDPLFTLWQLLRQCGGVFALEYDEIEDHLEDLVALLETEVEPPDEPEPVHHPQPDLTDRVDLEVHQLDRTAWVDALEFADDVLVLLPDTASLLSGITASVWLALAKPATLEQLVEAAQERHGRHPEARAVVAEAVEKLIEQGVIFTEGPLP